MRVIAILAALAGCGGDLPCDGIAGACIDVTIGGGAPLDTIALDLAYGTRHDRIERAASSLPAAFALELDEASPVTIVAASLRDGAVTGAGFGAGATAIQISLAAAPACTAGTNYCGGDRVPGDPDSVYRCIANDVPEQRGACLHGCAATAGACTTSDVCRAGHYCGGDKVIGDPHALYLCQANGTYAFEKDCANRCVVAAEGKDDYCE